MIILERILWLVLLNVSLRITIADCVNVRERIATPWTMVKENKQKCRTKAKHEKHLKRAENKSLKEDFVASKGVRRFASSMN